MTADDSGIHHAEDVSEGADYEDRSMDAVDAFYPDAVGELRMERGNGYGKG